MKRVLYFVCLLLLFIVISTVSVKAEECTYTELKELKQLAQKVQISYEYSEKSKVFNLSIYNLSDKVVLGNSYYVYNTTMRNFESLTSGDERDFKLVGGSATNCKDELLRTIKIRIPYYNRFYDSEQCKDLDKFTLCKKWTNTSNVTQEQFEKEIKEYLTKKEKKTSFIDDTVQFLKDNYIYIGISLGLIMIVVAIIIYQKKFKKKALDL